MSDAIARHFVVVPVPAFGHITPFLELSRKLVRHHHHITFVVSAATIPAIRLRELISPEEETDIELFGLNDGLAEEWDKNISPKQLALAMEQMALVQREFLERLPVRGQQAAPDNYLKLPPVDAVIADISLDVPTPVCRKRQIPVHVFCCAAGWTIVDMLAITENTPTCDDEKFYDNGTSDGPEMSYPNRLPKTLKKWLVGCTDAMLQATSIVVNSFERLEPDTKVQMVHALPAVDHIPVRFVGPLFPSQNEGRENAKTSQQVALWLDGQRDRSVVYVSFGSIAAPVPQQIIEIMKALLESKRPFIWSLRTTEHHVLPAEIRDSIKKQFDDSIDASFLILNWAPQKTVLEHRAIRVFVSHCGWNSTLEGIHSGVPIVAWPMFGDQHPNAALVARTGVGIVIPNVSMQARRIVEQGEIWDAISTVAGWDNDKPNAFYRSVQELSTQARMAIGPDGKSTKDFQQLLL